MIAHLIDPTAYLILRAKPMTKQNVFSLDQLQSIASEIPSANSTDTRATQGGRFDVEAYLIHFGIDVAGNKQHGDSTLYLLKKCLFDPSHTEKDAAIGQTKDGNLFYKCFHDSCKQHSC